MSSAKLRPNARTATRTSPGLGIGTAVSRISQVSRLTSQSAFIASCNTRTSIGVAAMGFRPVTRKKIVEAAILLNDDDDVLNLLRRGRRLRRDRERWRHERTAASRY